MNVAVIGAGISGLLSAYHLLMNGVNVTIFERRGSFPRLHCAGIVSKSTLENIPYANNFIVGKYNTIAIYLNICGRIVQGNIYFKDFAAYKIDRYMHEAALAKRIKELGAPINSMSTVTNINECCKGVEIQVLEQGNTSSKKLLFDRVVVAEGYPGRLSTKIGCRSTHHSLHAIQRDYIVKGSAYDRHTLYVYIDPQLFGYGFAWFVPFSDEKAVIGYASNKAFSQLMYTKIVKVFRGIIGIDVKNSISSLYGGNVLIGYPIKFISKGGRCFCIGDAVTMVKSISGGGLYAISYFAKMLPNLMIREDRREKEALNSIARELMNQYYIRKMFWHIVSSPVYGRLLSLVVGNKSVAFEARSPDNFDKHERMLQDILIELYKLFLRR